MNFSAQLRPLIEKHGLGRVCHKIQANAVVAVHLLKHVIRRGPPEGSGFSRFEEGSEGIPKVEPAALGQSKMGGVPDLPADLEWPQGTEGPLGFIAQIDCAAVHAAFPASLLPKAGMLFFFYDFIEQPWGGERPANQGYAVRYVAALARLSSATVPASSPRERMLLQEFPIHFKAIPSLPGYDTSESEQLGLKGKENAAYWELRAEVNSAFLGPNPRHQQGGFADNIQGDVRTEFEVYVSGGAGEPGKSDWELAGQHAADWQLLLQVDSDPDLGVMWGDVGMIYFGLRREDLAAARFDRSRVILQCS